MQVEKKYKNMIHCIISWLYQYLKGAWEKTVRIVWSWIKERKSMKEQSKKTVAKKKFFKMVFSRAGFVVILILIQILESFWDSILSERVCNLYIQCDSA